MADDQQYRALLDLVRRVRHDANNPITAALGHVQLLLDDPGADRAAIRDGLQVIEGELHRLTDIIRRLNEARDESRPAIV
jgi:signal transduction histidine kinase